jgi:hypothetical protein
MTAQRAHVGMKARLAAVLLATLSTYASADDRASIHLTVRGAIDASALAVQLAAELARPIDANHNACPAPCVSVVVSGDSATVLYTDTAGTTRARTLELGREPAQWPTLITLLAGNLVRDEAAELLPPDPDVARAAPSAPQTPPQPALAEVVPPPVRQVPIVPPPAVAVPIRAEMRGSVVVFGLVPGLSTDLVDFDRSHEISVGLVASASAGAAFEVAGAVDISHQRSGVQIAGALTVANDVSTQLAGALAIAKRADVQAAGAVAVADHAVTQLAGATNIAGDTTTQVAGALNVASLVHGLQLAPVNIARRVEGVQIGVVNIGGGPDDESFGLLNIVPGGRTDLEAAVDTDRIGTLTFRHGGKHWHNVYGVGAQHEREANVDQLWMLGLGLGASFHVLDQPVDLEGIAWQVNQGKSFDTNHVNLLNQARLTVAIPVGPIALAVGGAINVYVTNDHTSPLYTERTIEPTGMTSTAVKIWPSLFVGARL